MRVRDFIAFMDMFGEFDGDEDGENTGEVK